MSYFLKVTYDVFSYFPFIISDSFWHFLMFLKQIFWTLFWTDMEKLRKSLPNIRLLNQACQSMYGERKRAKHVLSRWNEINLIHTKL